MTTLIYLFLMGLTLFVVPQIVVKLITKSPKFDKNILYLVFASILPLLWIFVPDDLASMRPVNFLQHAIGGGVSVGLVAIYLINSLKEIHPPLKIFVLQLVFVYAMVSMFGVANEILEFLLDYLDIGIFSADRYDTWFDLVANTTGAFFIFFIHKIRVFIYSKI